MLRLPWRPRPLPSWTVPTAIGLCLIVFTIWLVTTLLPVAWVEVRYQYRRVLTTVFGTYRWRTILYPDIHVDLTALGENKQYGIVIPKLYLDEPVVFNVDPNNEQQYRLALRQGIAHASGTAFPGNGGVGYYFAHSSTPELRNQYNAVFYLLGKLQAGDDIYIWHNSQKYHYQVTKSMITNPQDLSFLQPTAQETIVLQTCWPPGTSQSRLLVWATIVR